MADDSFDPDQLRLAEVLVAGTVASKLRKRREQKRRENFVMVHGGLTGLRVPRGRPIGLPSPCYSNGGRLRAGQLRSALPRPKPGVGHRKGGRLLNWSGGG
jgi:hypothetical protein